MKSKIIMEGITLAVNDVKRSIEYYKKLGFICEWNSAPHFALLRLKGSDSGTIGLLAWSEAKKDGAVQTTQKQKRAIHVELSTSNLDELYKKLIKRGVKFHIPPHDEPWEKSATAFDPDGYSVEFAEGRRGKKAKKK